MTRKIHISEERICRRLDCSNEVETFYVLAEVLVRDGHGVCLGSLRSFADEVSQSVGVLNWRRYLDGARNVVVGEAQLVSQKLDEVGFFLDRIVNHDVMGGRNHSLSGGLADQEEVVGIGRHDVGVHNCAGQRVSESLSVVAFEESLVHSLIDKDDHHFDFIFRTNLLDGRLDLREFVHQDGLALRLTDTITVDNNMSGENPVFVFEFDEAFLHDRLKAIAKLLAFVLNTSSRPEPSSPVIDTPAESKDRLLPTADFMEHINTTDHGRGVKVGQVIHCPRLSTHFGTDLDENLIADRPHILAPGNGVDKHNLRWDWNFLKEQSLQVVIERSFSLGSWQNQNYRLYAGVQVLLESGLPLRESVGPYAELPGLVDGVSELLTALLHGFHELYCHSLVLFTVEDSPLLEHGLFVHRLLNAPVNVRAVL